MTNNDDDFVQEEIRIGIGKEALIKLIASHIEELHTTVDGISNKLDRFLSQSAVLDCRHTLDGRSNSPFFNINKGEKRMLSNHDFKAKQFHPDIETMTEIQQDQTTSLNIKKKFKSARNLNDDFSKGESLMTGCSNLKGKTVVESGDNSNEVEINYLSRKSMNPFYEECSTHLQSHLFTFLRLILDRNDDENFYLSVRLELGCPLADAKAVLLDKQITNPFLDMYLLHKTLTEFTPETTILYMPTSLPRLIEDETINSSMVNHLRKCIPNYIPSGFKPEMITKMFIPMLDQNHWFLLVRHFGEETDYIIDLAGRVHIKRVYAVSNMLHKAKNYFKDDPVMKMFFKGAFKYTYLTPSVQPNAFDCGMYMLKYIEAPEIKDCSDVQFSTEDMRKERIDYFLKLFMSKSNESKMKSEIMGKSVD